MFEVNKIKICVCCPAVYSARVQSLQLKASFKGMNINLQMICHATWVISILECLRENTK